MIKISHRGNLKGPVKELENSPKQIQKVLKKGFQCEIDVWYVGGSIILAHELKEDKNYRVNDEFLTQKGLWCHAKNFDALNYLKNLKVHFFWHENDKVTITSKNYVWCHPNIKNSLKIDNSIICLPEIHKKNVDNFSGYCSDYIQNYFFKFK
jgi:hypothetical protein